MHVTLEYTEEAKTSFSESFFQMVALRALEECQFSFLDEKEISLNVVAVTPEKMRELNAKYRDKNNVTDILSFSEYVDRDDLEQVVEEDLFLGEIFFCPAFIERAAKEDLATFEREMVYVFSHGVLHLVGFDHEEEMFEIQERVTDGCSC